MRFVLLGAVVAMVIGCAGPEVKISVRPDLKGSEPSADQKRKDYESSKVLADYTEKEWRRHLAEAKTDEQREAAQRMLDMIVAARKVNEINKP